MDIKISIGFGRKGQHTARVRNAELETQVQVLTEALQKEKEDNKELKEQLAEALRARVAKGRRMTMQAVQVVKPIESGPVRFQVTGGSVRNDDR